MSDVRIGKRRIGCDEPPLVIAEMSGNHNQSLDRALAIVEAAARCGVHALKLQTYTPETMTLDLDTREFHIEAPNSLWKGASLYRLYEQAQTPWEWHAPLFERARALGLEVFSTPFDETAVEFLEHLDPPCYKIASFENTDLPLVRRVAATGRPLLISTGMATVSELDETVSAARDAGARDIVLLKCTSAYPAGPENANLMTIPHLRALFNCEVGLSDHTPGVGVAVASVALGASVIEKHFTVDRAEGGVDSAFSMEPAEMAMLVTETDRAWRARGTVAYGIADTERASLQFRRSLYIVKDLNKGDILNRDNVRAIRPGFGLPPKFMDLVLGRTVRRNVARGTPVDWSLI